MRYALNITVGNRVLIDAAASELARLKQEAKNQEEAEGRKGEWRPLSRRSNLIFSVHECVRSYQT